MCSMAKGSLISCQITYFPIHSKDYLHEIDQVIDLIRSYPLKVDVGILSTTIQGESETIYRLIKDIHDTMEARGYHFTMSIMVSNICGCQ